MAKSPILSLTRTLRTESSERYLLHWDGKKDVAALELHYLPGPKVAGTLILLDKQLAADEMIHEILHKIDETLLPDVALDEGSLAFTVVLGKVLGTFSAEKRLVSK